MSSSKQAQSGLGTIKRDFSTDSHSSQRSNPDLIYWPPTPGQPSKKPLTGVEQRLKDIQDALAGRSVPTEKVLTNSSSQFTNKRPAAPIASEPPAKRRQLPDTWSDPVKKTVPKSSIIAATDWVSSSRSETVKAKPEAVQVPLSMAGSSTKVAPVFLSQEQTQILKFVQEGQNVFYTGSAGTGKSVLLREIIKTLRKKYIKSADAVAVTASTGIAACNIGGVTIHSFGGIGLGIESAEELAQKIRKNKKAIARWLRTKVLIIDEISMVDGDLFDKLARIGSLLRKKPDEPFGGLQVIVTGDFFQLPPVTKGSAQVKFAFEAQLWKATIKQSYNLTKVFRQSDQEFVDMLNEMRFGRLSPRSISKFKSLSREIHYEDGLGSTELFPRREDVDRSNSTRMSHLPSKDFVFNARDGGTITDINQRAKILSNFMAPETLRLRIDAQVMLIKNMDETLVNGSMGRVVRFVDPALFGTDLDNDDEGTAHGGGEKIKVGGDGKGGKAGLGGNLCPVVEFRTSKNSAPKQVLVMPETWKVELPNGEIQVSRTQFPLILAWAMSIHKSQGQTLDRVKVDLGKVFEKGQAYVALSRATSLDGLQILNFDANKVNAHPKVAMWSRTLQTVPLN